jgi:hypothetical protein
MQGIFLLSATKYMFFVSMHVRKPILGYQTCPQRIHQEASDMGFPLYATPVENLVS